ncbi:MAG: hypothetical protein PHR52_10510 [Fermentimonas sp.]|nr:hypothetical protein [Fermentimonas sp.]
MIQEIINFTQNIDDQFINSGLSPKEGLHVMLNTITIDDTLKIDIDNFQYEIYSKKSKAEPSEFMNRCKLLHQNAWCINTNKCFDLPKKAIHTCSPFCVAFKREHLNGGKKFKQNESKNENQIYQRFGAYFEKAFSLFEDKKNTLQFEVFKLFFTQDLFSSLINKIELENKIKRESLSEELVLLKEQKKDKKNTNDTEIINNQITKIEQDLIAYKELQDSDYLIFYLKRPLEEYQSIHDKYLRDNIFVNDKYNTLSNETNKMYGVSGFMNTLNDKKPFLMHQTASFDIAGRISNKEAQHLDDFSNLLVNKSLPYPLPIFIYKEELQQKMIGLFQESGFKLSYKEIVEKLINDYSEDLDNYYLLYWISTKDGIVFKDFDFVSKFDYKLNTKILNLFELKEQDKKSLKIYSEINNVFQFEQAVFKQLLQDKYQKLDYFSDLSKDGYEKKDFTFLSYSKYRKSVYDFVYKSQRQVVDGNMFNEMVFNGILDDIKQGNGYGIKDKLNIWYSLYNFFNPKNNINMASKLESYQTFIETLSNETTNVVNASDTEFAFAAGQVIYYILSKSKSGDNGYQLLEPYLQKAKCSELKQAIANDFARYKHENFSKNFQRVAAFVLSYETSSNMKHLLPELLSGFFAKNQLFSNNSK